MASFKYPKVLFNGPRPDIVVKNGNKLTTTELSCCYETIFSKTRNQKIKHSKLQDLWLDKSCKVTKLYVGVASLEFRNSRV